MLVGREHELAQLESLLEQARQGGGISVVVQGGVGIGKTTLLTEISRRAIDFGVVTVQGVESESDLAFAGLGTLVRPLAQYLDRLPPAQRNALSIALAVSDERLASPYPAYLGLLSLVAAAAEATPQLVIVDDVQWLDQPSSEAILFAARRIGADRVAVVIATRAAEDGGPDLGGIEELALEGLDRDAARDVLLRHHPDLAASVVDRLATATGGIPLALIEVPGLLSVAQRSGEEALPDPLPAGRRIQDAFRRSLASLPRTCRDALVVLAADETGSAQTLVRALRKWRIAGTALDPAKLAGLIREVDGSFVFRHPMLRSTIYHAAPPATRRRAHATLAAVLGDAFSERRAWHLAAAATGPDDRASHALAEAARHAARRGAYASAAAAFEKSASLTANGTDRAKLLLESAEACRLGGLGNQAMRLLDDALGSATDALLRADIQLLRGRILFSYRSVNEAYVLLLEEAGRIEAAFPDRAATMLTEACWACTAAADVSTGVRAGERAYEAGHRIGEATENAAALALAQALVISGRGREARGLLEQCKEALRSRPNPLAPPYSPTTAMSYLITEDYEFAAYLAHAQVVAARDLASPSLLSFVLATRAYCLFRTGDWVAAYADGTEAITLADEVPSLQTRAFAQVILASIEAGLGRDEAVMRALDAEREIGRYEQHSLTLVAQSARGLFHLGYGRIDETIRELEETARLSERIGAHDPAVVPWMPDLLEAYVRAGRVDDAADLLASLEQQAQESEGVWARAVAARGRGLLAETDFEDAFREALALHASAPTPFEQARTELVYGERLRRAGRRADARPRLRSALATFERLGARGWARRASVELGASVEHVSRSGPLTDYLSPHELQVALQVAAGATNAETAAALFVTQKTVEFHLRNVYRKLGIRSRTDLARVMASGSGELAAVGTAWDLQGRHSR